MGQKTEGNKAKEEREGEGEGEGERNTVSQQVCIPWSVEYPYTQQMQQVVVAVGYWGLSLFVFEMRTFFFIIFYSFFLELMSFGRFDLGGSSRCPCCLCRCSNAHW